MVLVIDGDMKCDRGFKDFCKGEADKKIDNKPVCEGCKEWGEKFDG